MNILYWTDHLQAPDRLYAGEKAWQLSQLQQDNYPVCPGFVVSAELFRKFFEQLDDKASLLADFPASLLHLKVDDSRSLQWIAQQSRQALQQTPFPQEWQAALHQASPSLASPHLIVRASLSLAGSLRPPWSGLLTAQICSNQTDALEESIKQIWAQFLGAKSLFFWQRQGIALHQIYLAVLVQPIFPTLASGIALLQADHCEVRAAEGLGYGLLAGEMQPSSYLLDLAQGKLLNCRRGNQLRSYGLSLGEPASTLDSPLRSQILPFPQQTDEVLAPASLAKLMALLQRLARRSPEGGVVEWSLAAPEEEPAIYLHQWGLPVSPPRLVSFAPLPAPTKAHSPLVTGLGASPGIAEAIAYLVRPEEKELRSLPKPCILIASQILPQWLPYLHEIKGIVTEQGGMTSHAAILAREFGIPAIVNGKNALQGLKTGELIRIDGHLGTVDKIEAIPSDGSSVPACDRPSPREQKPLRTKLMVNLSQGQSVRDAIALPLDGIGLVRSELMMIELLVIRPLTEWLRPEWQPEFVQKLAAKIQEFAASFSPRPVFYRTYDEKGTAQTTQPLTSQPLELSYPSLLPQRGAYGYLLDGRLFDLELQAIKQVQAAGFTNLRLILPFVRTVTEIEFCVQRLQAKGLSDRDKLPLWMMAEVPSVLFQLPQYVAAGIQGIAIGTNDLSQLLLGADREATFAFFSQSICPPALLMALKQLIDLSHQLQIPCSLCGQAPLQYPTLIPLLIDWGVTALSVEPAAVLEVYAAIAKAEQASPHSGRSPQITPDHHSLVRALFRARGFSVEIERKHRVR